MQRKEKKMICDIIMRKENNRYIARAKEWPEVMVKGNSRDEAIRQVKTELTEYLTNQVEIIQIELRLPEKTANSWLNTFGSLKDDPTFENLQYEIAEYRKEIDREQTAE